MFSVLVHNIISFHCVCIISDSIHIYLCPIYFKIHVSSNLSIEDLSAKHMTHVVLSARMPGASPVVAPRDDGVCVSN